MSTSSGDMTAAFASALESADTAASAAEASPASTPAPDATTESAAPAATTQAVESSETPESVSAEGKPKGEPPAWRWQDILENTRKSVKAETEASIRKEYEAVQPFIGMSAEERSGLMVWNAALRGDPRALAQVAQVNPRLAAAISGRDEAPSEPEQEPQPDAAIQLPDGSRVPVFTPEGMKKREAWLQKQLESSLTQKFQPVLSTAEKLQQFEQQQREWQGIQSHAAQLMAPLRRMPFFDEFKEGLGKALNELPADMPIDQMAQSLYDAYAKALTAKYESGTTAAKTEALASIQQRAVAGTGNPSRQGAQEPRKFKPGAAGFAEALAHFDTADAR